MGKTLLIMEVSQKQAFIFKSKKLRENKHRSEIIAHVTDERFFQEAAGDCFQPENMVYSGGGHCVLCFDTKEQAVTFAKVISEQAMRRFNGMELFCKCLAYDERRTPGENLKELSKALERKKSLRRSMFRQVSFGLEENRPVDAPPLGMQEITDVYPKDIDEIAGDENFVGVVHIDGNGMGKRVDRIYQTAASWQETCEMLRRFSAGIQKDFEQTFDEMVETLGKSDLSYPIRPIILAGDDVCYVVRGSLALESARIFLEKLSGKANEADGAFYSACAGIALVHKKYPFHRAYDLVEELCSSAKRFGVEKDPSGAVSAMDWHIQFGQIKDGLSDIREDYRCEDGSWMTLRPIAVVNPNQAAFGLRDYGFLRHLCQEFHRKSQTIPRRKLKQLRNSIQQGEAECEYAIEKGRLADEIYHLLRQIVPASERPHNHAAFQTIDGERRCLIFDAIEIMDHCVFLEGMQ